MMEEREVAIVRLTKEEVQAMGQRHIEVLAGIAATVALNSTGANVEAALKEVDEVVDSMTAIMKNNARGFIKGIMGNETLGNAMQQGISEEIKRHMQ